MIFRQLDILGLPKPEVDYFSIFWPSISRDTKNFCCTCDVCQRLGKGKNPAPAPLQSLPLVNEPFAQVAIDIVGPLPVCKATGNRFVLTVLDLCTHYPEAIPLKQHTAAEVFGFSSGDLVRSGQRFHVLTHANIFE